MTSIPSAQSKPPPFSFLPSLPPAPKPFRQASSAAHASNSGPFAANDRLPSFETYDRPIKRRKVEQEPSAETIHLPDTPPLYENRTTSRYVLANRKHVHNLHNGKSDDSNTIRPRIPPLPEPPWAGVQPVKVRTIKPRSSCRVRAEVAVPNTPDAITPLKDVPHVEADHPVDYFVWKGNHPEDQLTQINVKQGYFDRAPDNPEKELNTAKAPIYNALSRRHGLDGLSALFSLLLDERAKHNTITGKQAVTLPPRVTLTEAKRKQWIADLANENVPMSKLKKAIPQGIRGQALLDLCSMNKVPRKRALWFIKCVGAIELRAIKKKGGAVNLIAANENKWLRDWTVGVEQWIEQVVARCGQADWMADMQYTTQLVVRLYHDNLLERDHYLDWLVNNFIGAKLEHTQAWLLLVNVCRVDMLKHRKRIRNLTRRLLNLTSEAVPERADSLLRSVKSLLKRNALDQPTSLLVPDQWQLHEATIRSLFNLQDMVEARALKNVVRSNARFMQAAKNENSPASRERRILQILDSCSTPVDLNTLSAGLLDAEPDLHNLCVICMKWATSKFRAGARRVYLAVRLLRRWSRAVDVNIHQTVLDFFCREEMEYPYDRAALQHFLMEVVRSAILSVSRFMQWLSVQSLPAAEEATSSHSHDAASYVRVCYNLLHHLPLANLETHDLNLRQYLLRRVNYDSEHEQGQTRLLERAVIDSLESASHNHQPDHNLLTQLQRLGWSGRSTMSMYLRSKALDFARTFRGEVLNKPPLPGVRVFSLGQFCTLRALVECLEDESVLADILRILSTTQQEDLLAALADTVNGHAESFAAIGALEPLQDIYIKKYIALRAVRPNLQLYATSLLDLCEQYPTRVTRAGALRSDLLRGVRERGVGPCSPFSETIAEGLQKKAGESFIEEFESILQAEVNMHEQTMSSLFVELVGRIVKAADGSTVQLCQLAGRLRLFKKGQFDVLMRQWLSVVLSGDWSNIGVNLVLDLLNARAVSVTDLVAVIEALAPCLEARAVIGKLFADVVDGVHSTDGSPSKSYIVRLGMELMSTKQPIRAFDFLSGCADEDRGNATARLNQLVPRLLLADKSPVFASNDGERCFIQAVDDLLETAEDGGDQNVCRVLKSLNSLSLPACRYRLSRSDMETNSNGGRNEGRDRAATCIFDRMKLSIEHESVDVEMVREVLMAVPPVSAEHIRKMCEQQLYSVFVEKCPARTPSVAMLPVDRRDDGKLERAVQKVMALDHLGLQGGAPGQFSRFIEMLASVSKWISSKNEIGVVVTTGPSTATVSPVPNVSPTVGMAMRSDDTCQHDIVKAMHFLNCILRALSSKLSALAPSSDSDAASTRGPQSEQIKLMALLIGIAIHPKVARLMKLTVSTIDDTELHDTVAFAIHSAALISDHLSEDGRSILARVLREKLGDKRVQWLIGSIGLYGSRSGSDKSGLTMISESRGNLGDFRVKPWEMLESHGGDPCLSLSLFGAVKVQA